MPRTPPAQLNGAVGDDLVDIHIGLRAAAGLPNAQWELVVELAGDDFVGGAHDQPGLFRRQLAEVFVHEGGGLLQDAEGADQLRRHGVAANGEVDQ